jgi:hypothetical protein
MPYVDAGRATAIAGVRPYLVPVDAGRLTAIAGHRALGSLQSDDMAAINDYFMRTEAKSSEARRLKDEWIRWYEGLWWSTKAYSSDAYDEARNRKVAFDRANAVTVAERENVERVIKTGMTTEEMQGQTRRMTSGGTYTGEHSGRYFWEDDPENPPWISTKAKIVGVVVLAAGVYAYFASAPLRKALKQTRGGRGGGGTPAWRDPDGGWLVDHD